MLAAALLRVWHAYSFCMFYWQGSITKAKKRPRKKSGSGSESETGSVSDTDEEDASALNRKLFIVTTLMSS